MPPDTGSEALTAQEKVPFNIVGYERRAETTGLSQVDGSVENDPEFHTFDLQRHPARQRFRARNPALLKRRRDRVLDLALRADADHFQEFANTQIE